MNQSPHPGSYLLRWKGDALDVTLTLDTPCAGRAAFRTNLGAASVRRREIIDQTEQGVTPLARAWHDVPMRETAPGTFTCRLPLDEVGVFSGKCCFFPADAESPVWPDGPNVHIKVEPAQTRRANAIYTVFPRQFGGAKYVNPVAEPGVAGAQTFLDAKGYTVIPPSGTLRDVKRSLGHILDDMKFRIVQLLPIFPTPTVFARMGRYGSPFAATDFLSVDPALAEFDRAATPLDQFRELADAIHAKGASLYLDLPANHTGWAATLQLHHPNWYHREPNGAFVSPGAWGVTWADLVELDYARPELRAYMADVFLFWCRHGVDGFRCDAGYMIPVDTWTYIVARVREEYPDTVFMLEGLGGPLDVTDCLLRESGLDWAYSEIFQTYDRAAFERDFPSAIARAETYGALVHFAETHDNDRLAKGGRVYARLRVQLAALLSHQGAWGIANGVEWFATEKIDVHGASALNWGAADNMVALIARLNTLLAEHPSFGPGGALRLVTRGGGNTLAVFRAGMRPVLVLANLDCGHPTTIYWDVAAFDATRTRDLVTGKSLEIDPRAGVYLDPGEVLCLEPRDLPPTPPSADATPARVPDKPVVTWTWPEDARRQVCVPAGCALRVVAPHDFRVEVTDGTRTLAVACAQGRQTVLDLPPYAGDGTRAESRTIDVAAFTPDGVVRTSSHVLITPPAAVSRVKLVWSGAEIRADRTLETVLSDGTGSMSRVKLAWGEIRSQYDALFAANVNPDVPGDRLVLWTRCRCWLQHEGFSREINADCIDAFHADPAGRTAVWFFTVPCGMGRSVRFSFTLALARRGTRAARLRILRLPGDAVAAPVRIVFRPDMEARSFHATTKAYQGPEATWEERIRDAAGFTVIGGTFHPEGEWTYNVAHPEEAERGQEPAGDLFSPGWVSCDFTAGASADLICFAKATECGESAFPEPASLPAAESVPVALRQALDLFVVKRDDVKTVIAGYPWFLDWGRDTFIFLRGAIAADRVREALDIVMAFARFEDRGTLPNIIYGNTAGNRDTADAPLFFILAVRDLVAKQGRALLTTDCGGRTLAQVLESIAENYVAGTSNGIHVDAASGLVWSPSHFTWMDTNYPACTPRHGYPVDIQALWIASLRFLGGAKWTALADKALESLMRYFTRHDGVDGLYDCLDAPQGEPAAAARPDRGIRPNQLFVLSYDLVSSDGPVARSVLAACERLLVPGGIRSLAAGDARYKGCYAGDEDTCRKPAYHNGTVWAWPYPMFVEAWAKSGLVAQETALSLLASVVENINASCVCHVSEIADGDAPHAQKGCRAQAWSASEVLRVWLELSK